MGEETNLLAAVVRNVADYLVALTSRWFRRRNVARTATGCLLLLCAIQSARGADRDVSMEPVIRVARANYERIKTLDIVWTEDDQPDEGILLVASRRAQLIKDLPTGRYRYEERQNSFDGRKDTDTSIEAFNGKVRTAYPSPVDSAGYIKRVPASGVDLEPQENDATGTCKAYAPVDFPFPPRFLEYLTECKVRTGPEIAGGFTCVVADHFSLGKIDGRIWLDIDRGAMPVQKIVFHEEKTTPMDRLLEDANLPAPGVESESWVTEDRRFTDGKGPNAWLPTKMKESDTNGTYTQEVDIAHTRLNPIIDPRQFRVIFPAGASVFNPATLFFFTTDPNDPSIDDTLPLPPPATQPAAPAK